MPLDRQLWRSGCSACDSIGKLHWHARTSSTGTPGPTTQTQRTIGVSPQVAAKPVTWARAAAATAAVRTWSHAVGSAASSSARAPQHLACVHTLVRSHRRPSVNARDVERPLDALRRGAAVGSSQPHSSAGAQNSLVVPARQRFAASQTAPHDQRGRASLLAVIATECTRAQVWCWAGVDLSAPPGVTCAR